MRLKKEILMTLPWDEMLKHVGLIGPCRAVRERLLI
jgi:hypothetical protein